MQSRFSLVCGFLVVVLAFSVTTVLGQDYRGHNWYFGDTNLGIRFNRSTNLPQIVTDKSNPFSSGGSAVATDPVNGNLLFYTDGSSIYDATHALMPNGTGLGANTSANQPVAIAKTPGQTSQYYVFANTANHATGGTVSFRIVDMSLFGNAVFPLPALGEAVGATNTAVAGLTGRSEAMITVPHNNGEDFWLITHANGNPDYSVTLFDATGPVATNTFAGVGLIEQANNFSYHQPSGRIAVSTQEPTRDIEVINFDNATGVITFDRTILNTGVQSTTPEAIYDTEWSANGLYLYISRHGEAGIQADVLQADLFNPFTSLASVLPQPNNIARSYGLQLAPDSIIYHLYQAAANGPFLLGSLANTDTVASEVIYDPSAFPSNNNFDGMQFPSFAPPDTIQLSVTFTSQGTCANSPVSFFPEVEPGADSLIWDFGDGTGAAAWSPVHTYTAGGTFDVTVIAFLNGDTASFSQPLNITAFDLQLTLVQDTTACACELPINNGKPTANPGITCPDDTSDDMAVTVQAQGGTPTYQWFGPGGPLTGQTTATLRPDSAGYYYVVATVGACSAYAGVNIKEYDSLNQQANIWHFGHNAGIDFNGLPDDPPVAIVGPLDTPEGTSVISDRNGQVIISTDGQNLFVPDGSGSFTDITPAPNPPGLGGEPESTQSALIMPVAGDETLFYIFTTKAVDGATGQYELRYSLYDLKLNNGLGGLAQWNQLLFSRSTERITGNDQWLIAHEFGNNSFRAYQVTQVGITNPVISAIGSDHTLAVLQHGQGYMELGAQNRLAVALSSPGVANVVEVFDFVDSSGVVTNFRTANLNAPSGQVYGLEISPGGNKLFATLQEGGNSQLFEFAFDTLGVPYLKQQVNQTGLLGAMQVGPDGQIYVAIDGSTDLGTFQANEDTTAVSNLALQAFALAGGTNSELGLPNFTQIISNPIQPPSFSFVGTCFGDSTQFTASGKDPAIDEFNWSFNDGTNIFDGGPQINHLFAAPGTYTVTVTITNKCETDYQVFTEQVVITAPPPDPSAGATMCTGSAVLDANPQDLPDFTYVWSTGATTETITVDQQAFYSVTVSDAQGCSTDGTFLASDNRPQVDFGPDLTLCQDTPVAPLDAQNPGATYSWTIDGVPTGGTAQTQSVDTSTPGLFEYAVQVTDPVTTCFSRDTINYTINESPAWTATPTDPSTCGANDGQISLNITAPVNTLFTYFITGPSTTISNTDQSPGVITTPANLGAGVYGITVADQVSGCATINTVNINDPAFTVSGTQNGTCDPNIFIDVTIAPTPGPLAPPFDYRVINSATSQVVETDQFNGPGLTFQTGVTLPSNNQQYIVEITSGGCTASSPPITINESPSVAATFTSDPCTDPITVTANSTGTGFAWSGPGIIGATTNSSISASPGQGPQQYLVTITQAGFCPLDTAITVNVNNNITADFTQSDACNDQVTLSATPTGPYTYRWFRNGALIPGGQQITVGLADNGVSYNVDIVNALSGCVFNSPVKTVNVAGELDVTLTSTTPCEGSSFTLTAATTQPNVTFVWTLNGNPIAGQSGSTLTDTREGLFAVAVTRAGCTVTDEFDIALGPVTPGLLQDSYIICPDPANPDPNTREVVLDPGAFLSYNWFKEQVSLGVSTRTYTATEIGNYSVEMINSFGCLSSDETVLVEECDPRITGPNAFRPGGLNREFFLYTFFIADTDFQIFIFNRWGEMVYQSNERDFAWNGGYNNNAGEPLPPGTYSYVVKYKSSYRPEDGIQEKRGGVVLLR